MEWLRPYLEDKLKEIKSSNNLSNIFTVDNSETQYELDMEYLKLLIIWNKRL